MNFRQRAVHQYRKFGAREQPALGRRALHQPHQHRPIAVELLAAVVAGIPARSGHHPRLDLGFGHQREVDHLDAVGLGALAPTHLRLVSRLRGRPQHGPRLETLRVRVELPLELHHRLRDQANHPVAPDQLELGFQQVFERRTEVPPPHRRVAIR